MNHSIIQTRGKATSRLVNGLMAICLVACASCTQTSERQSAEFGDWRGAERPMVLSGNPLRDSMASQLADEKLEEADWRILESLGPKAIWERLAFLNKQKKRQSTTGPSKSMAMAMRQHEPTTLPAVDVPIIPLPDGRLRIVYRLRHYGGPAVTASVDGGTQRRNVISRPPDLAPLAAVIATNVGDGGTVVPLPDENAMIITCAAAMKEPLLNLLARIDQPQRQVEITAKMFEVTHDFDFQYGAQLILQRLATDNSQTGISSFSTKSFANAVQNTATGNPSTDGSILRLMQVFQSAGISLDGTFQLMAESGIINVVAQPRMTVQAGHTGYMLAGQELPIQNVSISNSIQSTSTTYKPVGVQLYITPQAMGPSTVKLHAISVVSAVSGFAPVPTLERHNAYNENLMNPIIESREAETSVTLEDGSTLVFGGLRMIRTTSRESKIPGLGDIPGLGWLFKNHRSQKQLTDLYFFVTPTLL